MGGYNKVLIVTVTVNAAVDKTYRVDSFSLDRVNRPSSVISTAGGKGINVARVLRTLGHDVLATGIVGGCNGRTILSSLDEEGIPHQFVQTAGESRLCITIVDPVEHTETDLNEVGPEITSEESEKLFETIESLLPNTSHLVLSGSTPPGISEDFYYRAINAAKRYGVFTVLDSSGEHFRKGVTAAPDMIKPNVAELSEYVGVELYTVEDIHKAARELVGLGVGIVLVSMGRAGAMVTDGINSWQAVSSEIDYVSAVGCGDTFVAACVDAIIKGQSLSDMLRSGTAAGAANATVYGAGFCSAQSIVDIVPGVRVTALE